MQEGCQAGKLPNRGACRRAVRQENCQTAGLAGGESGKENCQTAGLAGGLSGRKTAKPRGLQERGRVEKFRCSDKMTEEDGVTSHTINPNPVAGSTPVSV